MKAETLIKIGHDALSHLCKCSILPFFTSSPPTLLHVKSSDFLWVGGLGLDQNSSLAGFTTTWQNCRGSPIPSGILCFLCEVLRWIRCIQWRVNTIDVFEPDHLINFEICTLPFKAYRNTLSGKTSCAQLLLPCNAMGKGKRELELRMGKGKGSRSCSWFEL